MPRRLTPEELAEARRRNEDGVPLTRIARDYGLSNYQFDSQFNPEKYARYAARHGSVSVWAEDCDRFSAEAKRRGMTMAALFHDLVERGIPRGLPRDIPEAAE